MRWGIKCFLKIQYECIKLSSIVQDFSPVIYYSSQLIFTTVRFSECMLSVWEKFIFIQMDRDIWAHYLQDTKVKKKKKTGRYTCKGPVTLIIEGTYIWEFHPSQDTAGKDGQKLDPVQWQSPLRLWDEAHQALKLWKGSNL